MHVCMYVFMGWLANSKELITASQTLHRIIFRQFFKTMNEHWIQLQHANIMVWVKFKEGNYRLNFSWKFNLPSCFHQSLISFSCVFSDCDDAMKDSLAVALRHSREQAQSTYDRRTANQKKAPAVQFARRKAEAVMEEEHDGAEQRPGSGDQSDVSVGDFVGLVMEDSTLKDPSVLVGRVQELLPANQVSLLWYKHKGSGLYSLEVEGGRWTEDSSALVPITVKPARGKVDCYRLSTSLRTIHKAVFDSRSL